MVCASPGLLVEANIGKQEDPMRCINSLWNSNSEPHWQSALELYDRYITRNSVYQLDKEIDPLDKSMIRQMTSEQWFQFLYQKYFPWKYTAPNRLATTRASLLKHRSKQNGDSDLYRIKQALLQAPVDEIRGCLKIASRIGGLGVAGASGLLSLMYPEHFGTVDEFLIVALNEVRGLPEGQVLRELALRIEESKSERRAFSINISHGVMLINILRRKAYENNTSFNTSFWTPRKIDKVLWAYGHC